MRSFFDLVAKEPRARRFFLAHGQSALGTAAGYVALIVLAYQRLHSPWGITLVLVAEFLPAMVLAPVLGAAVDRWPRLACAIAADLARAVALIGIAFVGGIVPTVLFALVAGFGSALFFPAALAALPETVAERRIPAAMSLYGALTNLGMVLGPALGALALSISSAAVVCIGDGITFALSALLIATLWRSRPPIPARASRGASRRLVGEARDGLTMALRTPGVTGVLTVSGATFLFLGMVNVAELLITRRLGGGAPQYSALVAVFGGGVIVGSLTGVRRGGAPEHARRYLTGTLCAGVAMIGLALARNYVAAAIGFALIGLGNGLVVVNQRLLLQALVPDAVMGRVFSALDALCSWALAAAYLSAGVLVALFGVRGLLAIAGAGALVVFAASASRLAVSGIRAGRAGPTSPPTGYTDSPSGAVGSDCPAITARTASL